ncbi:PREDICTED: trace amine-associated receptor 1-like [Acropora digitifera]|uniref:trace amine-associated receptor 1-like n=1 Tax=Acropora digitifera TaxID=70779 RepID=UPI00077A6011|nr:PREDICTED: trace amine-associated receptor 1-like [Acropora digitifera]
MYNNSMDKQNETVGSLTTFSPNECIGWFVVLAIVGVATTTINALTVIVYLLEQRLRKRTMYLVISLAVADMCVGGISLTIDVSMSGFSCGLWKIDPPPKGIWPTILIVVIFVFNMASVINLAAISLERTHATFRPFQHRVLSKWIFGAAVAAVWITAVLSASYIYLDLFFTLSGPGEFYSYLSILSFCFFVMAVSYVSIVGKMFCGTQLQHHSTVSRERKLTKTLFTVTVASLMLMLPYIICFFLIFSKRPFFSYSSQTLHFRFFLVSLVYVNSMVNPILYTLRIPEFKRALVSILRPRSGAEVTPQSDS